MEAEYEKHGYLIQVSDGGFMIEYDNTVIATEYFEYYGGIDDSEFEPEGRLLILEDPESAVSSNIYTVQLKDDDNGTRCLINGKVFHSSQDLNDDVIDFESYTQRDE